jgi:SAM-dependent methyltransferase
MLNENDINEIYNKYVAINYNNNYYNKYVPLPLQYNNKNWKWEGKDFPRILSLLEFREYMIEYNKTFDNVLSFNGTEDPEYEYIKYNNCYNYNYNDNKTKYDLHSLELDRNDFDFVMFNQTIEHLYNPILAIQNVYKHMKIGGMFYANVPSNNIPHSTPFHYYTGVTPTGLGVMVKLAGFDILKIGQWGNLNFYKQAFDNRWSDYILMSKICNNPGYNDINCPIITWILAIKNKYNI